MKGVVLAAGKGTRMKELTKDRPKPMIETGKRKIILHIFDYLKKAGISELVIVTGYYANLIEDQFQDGSAYGLRIRYIHQEVLDGTGSATLLTEPYVGQESFYLTYGDIMAAVENYPRLIEFYKKFSCDGVISVCEVEDPYRGAAVYVDQNLKVEKIIEKPAAGSSTTRWNNAGIYIFRPKIFEYLKKIKKSPRGEYELPDAFTAMMRDGYTYRAFPITGYWGDLGTPEDVERMNQILSRQRQD